MTECDHEEDHNLVSALRDLLYHTEANGLTFAETMQDRAEFDVLHAVTEMQEDLDEIRATLDIPDEKDTVEAIEHILEKHDDLEYDIANLLHQRGDTLQTIDELLDDVAEMVKLLDPILGGFCRTDDMDTITMRVLVDRISRKLLGR